MLDVQDEITLILSEAHRKAQIAVREKAAKQQWGVAFVEVARDMAKQMAKEGQSHA